MATTSTTPADVGPESELLAALQRLELETEHRTMVATQLEPVDYIPARRMRALLAPPGAIAVYVGRRGSAALEQMREATLRGDNWASPSLRQIRQEVRRLAGLPAERTLTFGHGRTVEGQVRPQEAADLVLSQPVFAHVTYGGRTLLKNVFVPPGSDLVGFLVPYNGGRLAERGFQLVEFRQPGQDVRLDAVVVRHGPDLTAAESAALRQLPPRLDEVNVGAVVAREELYAASPDLLLLLVVAAFFATYWEYIDGDDDDGTVLAQREQAPGEREHLEDAEVRALGPEATARALVRLRVALFERLGQEARQRRQQRQQQQQ